MPMWREKSSPYSHHLLHFHITLFDYWGLHLHRRLHLLGDAPTALLFARCQWGEGRAEELLPWRSPSNAAGSAAAGTRRPPSQSCCCPVIRSPTGGSRALQDLCLNILIAAITSGPDHRPCWVAQVTLHWMLRLRYCRNMLASWGRFSSLGCILV